MKRRHRHRRGEVVCRCRAYGFPHRMCGGRCTGHGWVIVFFEPFGNDCRRCSFNEGSSCQVAEGIERPWECPAFQDMAASAEMKKPKKLCQALSSRGNARCKSLIVR